MTLAKKVSTGKMRQRRKPEPMFSITGAAVAAGAILALWVLTGLLPFSNSDAAEVIHVGCAILAGAVLFGGGKAEGGRGKARHAH